MEFNGEKNGPNTLFEFHGDEVGRWKVRLFRAIRINAPRKQKIVDEIEETAKDIKADRKSYFN